MSNLFRVDVPMNPSPSEDNVIANTKLLRDTVGWTCKNLFNPYNAHYNCALVTTLGTDLTYIESSNGGLTYVTEIETDTDYTVSKKIGEGNRFEIALFTTEPTIPNTTTEANSIFLSGNTNPYTFNSENYHWVAFTVNDDTGDPSTIAETVEAMIRRADLLEDDYEPYHIDVNTSLNMLNEHVEDSIMVVERDIEDVNARVDNIFDYIYPVGSIYLSLDSTFDPNTMFGGTWERIRDAFLYGATASGTYTIGNTGGEKTHTLTIAEMPSHAHEINLYDHDSSGSEIDARYARHGEILTPMSTTTTSRGSGQAHNNMPPYLCVNMWKRVADYYNTSSPFFKTDTGLVCTGLNSSSTKTEAGDCYCGMAVWYEDSVYKWTPFCISRQTKTRQNMTYQHERKQGGFKYNDIWWYYSYDDGIQVGVSQTDDETDPSSRRYYYGTYSGSSSSRIKTILQGFLDTVS